MTRDDAGRSRVTGLLRLGTALWLIVDAVSVFADPVGALARSSTPEAVQPMAALSFCLGMFLLTGFMSRVAGLLLVGLGLWQATNVALVVVGLYFMLRGGGAWAMDIYVQKMQDRVRQREALEASAHANSGHAGLE
jgi:hypothetical protein